jgi:hypothetical protein
MTEQQLYLRMGEPKYTYRDGEGYMVYGWGLIGAVVEPSTHKVIKVSASYEDGLLSQIFYVDNGVGPGSSLLEVNVKLGVPARERYLPKVAGRPSSFDDRCYDAGGEVNMVDDIVRSIAVFKRGC